MSYVSYKCHGRYWLFIAEINLRNATYPRVLFDEEMPLLDFGPMAQQFMAWTTNSGIYSRRGRDMFVFTQAEPSGLLKNTKRPGIEL